MPAKCDWTRNDPWKLATGEVNIYIQYAINDDVDVDANGDSDDDCES